MSRIPRSKDDDYSNAMAQQRRDFVREQTRVEFKHTGSYSFDAADTRGNIEHFTGVCQIPLGLAGPLKVNGEHAQGDFYVPMTTTEGTLVGSYNRGMRLTREAGGITVSVVDDVMQRAPVFIATGQDEANVAESQSAIVHSELTEDGDLYYSITLPSLIVATHGGGTGLPTQRECLEMMGCFGKGRARKLAEIIGATVLCGELSLGAAVLADEWVSCHEKYGRNR